MYGKSTGDILDRCLANTSNHSCAGTLLSGSRTSELINTCAGGCSFSFSFASASLRRVGWIVKNSREAQSKFVKTYKV
jgi:hypothetical protein